jgi:hypothetical protein
MGDAMRCSRREDGCTRPDSDGADYEYWADEDGEHKGAMVRAAWETAAQRNARARLECLARGGTWTENSLRGRCEDAYVVGYDAIPRRRRLQFDAETRERMREEDRWYQAGFAHGVRWVKAATRPESEV